MTQPTVSSNRRPAVVYTRGVPLFQDGGAAAEDLGLINRLAPAPLRLDQVYVRSMYLCSSQLCLSDGCRFTPNALRQIAQLVIGQSVLTGHDRSSLPLARFFRAEVVSRGVDEENEPVYFVRAWFYWLRETTGSRDLLLNIDGGIYREVSLAWKYAGWNCSICQRENGECGHRVGEMYNGARCYRRIDRVVDVLEGSLVYKGADRNTCLTGVHERMTRRECSPVFLLFRRDDPWLARFRSWGVLLDQHEFSEGGESFRESVDHLWIRAAAPEDLVRFAHLFLTDSGAGLGETIHPQFPEDASESFLLFRREDAEMECLPLSDQQEVCHAAVG